MEQKRSYKTYTKEFKAEAVSWVTEQGYSVAEAAKSLGVRTSLLYRWKQQIEDQQQGKMLTEDERVELKRLRMEQDILKKASAFLAKEVKWNVALFNSNQEAALLINCVVSWKWVHQLIMHGVTIQQMNFSYTAEQKHCLLRVEKAWATEN